MEISSNIGRLAVILYGYGYCIHIITLCLFWKELFFTSSKFKCLPWLGGLKQHLTIIAYNTVSTCQMDLIDGFGFVARIGGIWF